MDLELIELAKLEAWMDEAEADFVKRASALVSSLSAEIEPVLSQAKRSGGNLPDTFEMPGRKRYMSLFWDFLYTSMVSGYKDGKGATEALRKKRQRRKELARRGGSWIEPVTDPQEYLPTEALQWLDKWTDHFGKDYYNELTSAVVDTLRLGMMQGGSIIDIMDGLSRVLNGPQFNAHRLEVIARTNLTTAYNQGRLQSYWEDSDFIKAVRYSAILDKRVTLICKERHGKIIPLTDIKTLQENTPPMHYNCRSLLAPVDDIEFSELAKEKNFRESMDFSKVVPPSPGFGEFRVNYKGMPQPPPAVPEAPPPPSPAAPTDPRAAKIEAIRAIMARQAGNSVDHSLEVGKAVFDAVESEMPANWMDIDGRSNKLISENSAKTNVILERMKSGEITQAQGLQELKELQAEFSKKIEEVNNVRKMFTDKLWDIMGQLRKFGNESPLNLAYTKAVKSRAKLIQDSAKYFPADWWEEANNTTLQVVSERNRAYYSPSANAIGLQKNEPLRHVIHECSHMMDNLNPDVGSTVMQYFNRRTAGLKLGSLKKEVNWMYDKHEKYYPGSGFYHPYMAKFYSTTTEITSMTMPNLAGENHDFYKQIEQDRETMEFVTGLLLTV